MARTREEALNTIKNLLETARRETTNEHEAVSAALMAQRLMAKYNVEMNEVEGEKITDEIVQKYYYDSGKHEMKKWKVGLAAIIAKNFRCEVYFLGKKDIVFYGYERDAEVALSTFTFLYEIGNKFAVRYYNKYKKEGKDTRGVMNQYLIGFRDGISEELEKQCTALMIITPKEVKDSFAEKTAGWGTINSTIRARRDAAAYESGKTDGKNVAQARSIEGGN